jgi:glycosyltransferase involved in cell wall biosynthesis
MEKLGFSIFIPTYNGADFLKQTLNSIFNQSFNNYEIIICDDASTDNTAEVIKSFNNPHIKYYRNEKNLGYGHNLKTCRDKVNKEILFLMGHDDILLKDALKKTYEAFTIGDGIGVVTRPYYWFEEDYTVPVRREGPYNENKDCVISIFDGERELKAIIDSSSQLSGLAYRVKYMDIDFHEDIFPAHVYPLASILKKYKAVYLKDFTIAVRIGSSQTRHLPQIYEKSPTQTWINMFKTVYPGDKYTQVRTAGIKHMCENYLGLVQIKNYGNMRLFLKEVGVMLRYRWQGVFDFSFWFYFIGCLLMPRRILIWMVDHYKRCVLRSKLKDLEINI